MSLHQHEWKDGPRSSAKKLERLRSFLRFAQRRDWIVKNPACDLKAPKVRLCPTMPYTREEMMRILAAKKTPFGFAGYCCSCGTAACGLEMRSA